MLAAPHEEARIGMAMVGVWITVALAALAVAVYALWRGRALGLRLRAAEEREAELARKLRELETRRLERGRDQEARLRFFDLAQDLFSIARFDGRLEQLNPAWETVLGYPLNELLLQRFLDFVHPEDRELTASETQRLRMGGRSVDFENRYRFRDGGYRWLSWRAVAVPAEERIYAVARDVSERKKLDQVKSDFVSVVSHELRTPLTSIRGSLGLLSGGVGGEIPEPAKSLIEIAAKNCDRLVRLINDILDVEKVASGSMRFRFQLVDLAILVQQAVETNQAYAQPFNVRYAVVPPLPVVRVRADPDRLLQVLANLLSNAAKFSPRNGQVEILVTRTDGRVSVAVTDHGPGIPEDFRDRVFERFTQADASSSRQKGGTGLGLSISKAIVERHGGRLGFTTETGKGTTFTFELPEWGSDVEMPEEPLAGPRILVCEDDPDVATLLRLLLEREGYQVDIATNAADTKRQLALGVYSAMTLDLMLPDQDGVSLFRELREEGRTSQLPVVVVSARAEDGQVGLAGWNGGALGVLDWLVKPVDPARLATAVRRAVQRAPSERAQVLHIEDDPDLQKVVAAVVGSTAEVTAAGSLEEARRRLVADRFDLVILDLVLPDGSGLDLLPFLGSLTPPIPVVLFSALEVGEEVARQVASVLVKSQTSNRQLLETIQSALPRGAS
jgi:PAS domain S-box-containing protein